MAKENKTPEQNEQESKVVDTKENTESFDVNKVDYDALDEAGRKDAFNKLKMQNQLLVSLIKDFTSQVEELEEKANGKVSDENYKRLAADFENYKRRNANSVSSAYGDGKFEVLKSFLEVYDNIDRAIESIKDEASKAGVVLIKKQCDEILKKFNVTEIEAQGKAFDPNLHHAVMQGEAKSPEEVDTITEVFQKGYTMGDKVLRYSFVKVAK